MSELTPYEPLDYGNEMPPIIDSLPDPDGGLGGEMPAEVPKGPILGDGKDEKSTGKSQGSTEESSRDDQGRLKSTYGGSAGDQRLPDNGKKENGR